MKSEVFMHIQTRDLAVPVKVVNAPYARADAAKYIRAARNGELAGVSMPVYRRHLRASQFNTISMTVRFTKYRVHPTDYIIG